MGFLSDIMSDNEGDEFGTKVAENTQWRLWVNEMTKMYERQLCEYDNEGFTLQGKYVVVLAENKISGDRTYLMMDKVTQEPYADWQRPEEFDFKKTCILMDLKEDCSIINMAFKVKKKKKKK